MTQPKEHNNFLVTDAKEMEIYHLPHEKFKTIDLTKFSGLQENTEKQFDKIKKHY